MSISDQLMINNARYNIEVNKIYFSHQSKLHNILLIDEEIL